MTPVAAKHEVRGNGSRHGLRFPLRALPPPPRGPGRGGWAQPHGKTSRSSSSGEQCLERRHEPRPRPPSNPLAGVLRPTWAPTRPPQSSRHPQAHGLGVRYGTVGGQRRHSCSDGGDSNDGGGRHSVRLHRGLPVARRKRKIGPEHEVGGGEGDAQARSDAAASRMSADGSPSPGPRTVRGPPRYGTTDVRRRPTYSRRFSRTICSKLAGVGGQPSVM